MKRASRLPRRSSPPQRTSGASGVNPGAKRQHRSHYDAIEQKALDGIGHKQFRGAPVESEALLYDESTVDVVRQRNHPGDQIEYAPEYQSLYKSTIANYPDTYYAYRAYIALKHIKATILNASIKPLPVEYPYKGVSTKDVILRLAQLQDYEVLDLITDAMEKVSPKPPRNDLRWRLVYPIDYYDEIKKYSNTPELMLALMREESYFNPKATSSVGARGLMQLMPATASEIYGSKINPEDLYNPEFNIQLGNTYYTKLRNSLNGYDISAVASYNGGIGSIKRWQTSITYNDTDEFVEQIPYAETKNYVKKVFRSYWNYLRIYTFDE